MHLQFQILFIPFVPVKKLLSWKVFIHEVVRIQHESSLSCIKYILFINECFIIISQNVMHNTVTKLNFVFYTLPTYLNTSKSVIPTKLLYMLFKSDNCLERIKICELHQSKVCVLSLPSSILFKHGSDDLLSSSCSFYLRGNSAFVFPP